MEVDLKRGESCLEFSDVVIDMIIMKLCIRLPTHSRDPADVSEEKEDCISEEHPVTDLRILQRENLN